MSIRIFNLRNVPDDEADDIRELLARHSIDYYETPAGNWGISAPSLWLRNDHQLKRAKELIDVYQKERGIKARAAYLQQKQEGKNRTIFDEIKEHPVRVLAYLLFALVILYFSTKPFLSLGQ